VDFLQVEAVLFDLDGTIIDSYPGIQKAFDNAYLKLYSVENKISIQPFIGPPLPQILSNVNTETDPAKISTFIKFFKDCYDTEDFKSSILYFGVKPLLEQLDAKGIKLFIVTNKRHKPTQLIMQYLGIEPYFCASYCSDLKEEYASKSEMVKDILKVESLSKQKCVLVGDTYHDKIAADQNEICFIHAAYGYGKLDGIERQILQPLDTLNFIN